MKIYTFPRGGIRFEDPTAPPESAVAAAFLPGLAVIPLVQHIGAGAYPIVSVGDTVKEGMLIGRGQGKGSANIHAAVPGRVIQMVSWRMGPETLVDALVIRMGGAFEKLGKPVKQYPWEEMPPFEIQRLIAEFGVVEMEGPGRPVSDMISALHTRGEPHTLVVRCVFDDPWTAADKVLCQERFQAVLEGGRIAARAARAARIVFAVSQGEEALGKRFLTQAASSAIPVSLAMVGSRYPQRNQRELALALRLYEKREALELGSLLIMGPATLAAVYDAVRLHKPMLDRYITVGGSAVKRPQVLKVRLGTRLGDVFAECGGFVAGPGRIASGSPLLGRPAAGLDEPVIKTTAGVCALLDKQIGGGAVRRCIGCGECRAVCPVGLDPEALYKRAGLGGNRAAGRAGECHGCGCCEVVCPSRLPLGSSIITFARREPEYV